MDKSIRNKFRDFQIQPAQLIDAHNNLVRGYAVACTHIATGFNAYVETTDLGSDQFYKRLTEIDAEYTELTS
jgi:hypothetical protein